MNTGVISIHHGTAPNSHMPIDPIAVAGLLSVSVGVLMGLTGVGGGFILVPALQKHTDLPVTSIVATSLGVLAFAAGAVLGMLAGGVLKFRISEQRIREISALLAFVIAIAFAANSEISA